MPFCAFSGTLRRRNSPLPSSCVASSETLEWGRSFGPRALLTPSILPPSFLQQAYSSSRGKAGGSKSKKFELTEEQKQEIREAFDLFDTDGSGEWPLSFSVRRRGAQSALL